MKTEKDFNKESKRLGLIGDPCQALEDAVAYKGTVYYWDMAFMALQNGAAGRILEKGLDPQDFGLEY
jgi:hypothetical protein